MRVAVLRPEPGNTATAARLEAHGLMPLRLPLFAVRPLAWQAPDPADFDALLLTSANTVRHAGDGLAALTRLPVVAVGTRTAAAARAAGLDVVMVGDADGAAAIAGARAAGWSRLLHLGGRDRIALPVTASVAVYASDAVTPSPPELAALAGTVALLHSPRAARHLARLVNAAGIERGTIALATLSDAITVAAGSGWRAIRSAATPSDDMLVVLAAEMVRNNAGAARVGPAEEAR